MTEIVGETDKEKNRVVVREGTAIELLDEDGDPLEVDHTSEPDGYVAFTTKPGTGTGDVSMVFREVTEGTTNAE